MKGNNQNITIDKMILHNNMNFYDKYVYEGDQPYAFISFSTHDSKIMNEIIDALHNANIRFWYTYHGDAISAGQDWLNELKLKIEKCAHFICVLSENYEKSAFCMFEFYHAINKNIIPLTNYKGYHIDDPIIKLKTANIQIWDFKNYLNSLNESKSENFRKIFACCDILQYNNSRYHPLKTYKELRLLEYPSDFEFDYTLSSELMEYPQDFDHDEYFKPHLKQSETLGFGNRNEPRPLLKRINFEKRNKKLKFNFVIYRNYGYLDHKAYTSWLLQEATLGLHPEYFRLTPGNLDFEDALWSTTGGGVWCITSDRMLIIPKRTFSVSEYPNAIGYSSAGGFSTDITNNNTVIDPFQYMQREIMSELGLKSNNIKFLKLLEIGVDKTRAHVQFSFFSSIDKTKDEIIASHNTCVESDELNLDFIPFTKETIYKKLYSPEIIKAEPGAIDSLFLVYEYYDELKNML